MWFGLVLWHINHCRSFNAKSFLYIYIKYTRFLNILSMTFLNEFQLIFFPQLHGFTYFLYEYTVKSQNSSISNNSL